ncbi:MAG: TolC family protein [Proteobacteria bacterium]|nr:TolC family protein [Pseudomonadota bacterium]
MRNMILALVCLLAAGGAAAQGLTLDQAVEEALANNPAMHSAQARQEAALSGATAARAGFLPSLSAQYRYQTLADDPFMRVLGHQTIVNSRDQAHWKVSASQPLFTGFALASGLRLAGLGVQTRDLEAREAALDVARRAKLACLELLLAEKALEVSRTARENLAAHEADAQRLLDQGLIPKNDLLKARVALAETVQEEERAKARVRAARSAVNVVLGRDFDADTRVEEWEPPETPEEPIAALVEEALAQRPELQALARAMDAKDQEARLALSKGFPKVELVGAYEQNGDDLAATNNDYSNDHNASVGIQAQWVFFQGGKTRAEAALARHEKQALAGTLAAVRDQVRLEVQQAWLDLSVAGKNRETASRSLEQARENWRIEEVRYQQQLSTSTEVLDAREYLTRAETACFQALYGFGAARADLDRALGRR